MRRNISHFNYFRAAAKNFKNVVVISDPNDYTWIAKRIEQEGIESIALEERKALAVKAFRHVVHYDSTIAQYLSERQSTVTRTYERQFDLKYGCNPHQVPSSVYNIVRPVN